MGKQQELFSGNSIKEVLTFVQDKNLFTAS